MIQGQKSLTLSWRSFSWLGRERVAIFLAYTGGQCFQYASKRPNLWSITWLTRPKIVDAPLTLIFKIGQGACSLLFGLEWRPILSICIKMAMSLINYRTYMTKNHWLTVDAQFQNRAGCVLLAPLPIKAACTSLMNVYDQSPCRVTMMRSQTWMTHILPGAYPQ